MKLIDKQNDLAVCLRSFGEHRLDPLDELVARLRALGQGIQAALIGLGPLFPAPPHPLFIGPAGLLGCALTGLLAGALSAILTGAVYAAEDAFTRLPIHWMWWPLRLLLPRGPRRAGSRAGPFADGGSPG